MSYAAMAAVRGSGLTDATTVDVLEALAFFLNDESGKCCPSTGSIARIARRSPNVVRQALKKLEADGLIATIQEPGRERYFRLFLDRLPKYVPLKEVKGVAEVKPLSEVTGDPFQKCEGTPVRSERGPLSEVKPEQVSEQVREQGNEQVVGAFDENAPPPNDSDLESMASGESLFIVEEHPVEKVPPKKKPRDPLVTFPETLPDDWRTLAQERRPEIDVSEMFKRMRTYYGPGERKALKNWKRTFLNWLVKERNSSYANNRNYRRGQPQPTAEDWASVDYSQGTWGY